MDRLKNFFIDFVLPIGISFSLLDWIFYGEFVSLFMGVDRFLKTVAIVAFVFMCFLIRGFIWCVGELVNDN